MTGFPLNADLRGRQAAFNASSRDQRVGFAGHRARISRLLAAEARPGRSRLCVVGAGNANDLDLSELLRLFGEVHLVDLDADALRQGVVRQGVADSAALHLHSGIDVTGLFDEMQTWTPLTVIGPSHLNALRDWPIDRVSRLLPVGFDVVISSCLLTQLMETATYSLGSKHPRLRDVTHAIGAGHLRLVAALAAPGGVAHVVTEAISSDTLPELVSLHDSSLEETLNRAEQARNIFRGVDRPALLGTIRHDPWLRHRVASASTAGVWRWRLHEKDYLTYALRLTVVDRPRGNGP